MSLVLDALLTLSWYFEDERTAAADAVLDRVAGEGAVVPGLWRREVANGFLTALRRRRLGAQYRDRALAELARLPMTIDPDSDAHAWTTTLRLADAFDLTLYDATYLELALRRRLPLATLDRRLAAAAAASDIQVLGISVRTSR